MFVARDHIRSKKVTVQYERDDQGYDDQQSENEQDHFLEERFFCLCSFSHRIQIEMISLGSMVQQLKEAFVVPFIPDPVPLFFDPHHLETL